MDEAQIWSKNYGLKDQALQYRQRIVVCLHPAHSHLIGGSWVEAKQGSVYISDGRVLPGSLLLWRTCRAQREEQRKELWVSFLPSLPTRQLGWLEDTCCAQGVCGWRLYPWGPGVGDAAGCGISYGLGSELPHGYNEPLISTDLIKGLLLTGGWGAPWASGRGCWAAQDSSLGMGGQTEEGQTRIHWADQNSQRKVSHCDLLRATVLFPEGTWQFYW